jgi:hypothetical protein
VVPLLKMKKYTWTNDEKFTGDIEIAHYGKGSALICAIDLLNLQDKPEARQLYYSILNYVNSDKFSPEKEIRKDVLHKIIP